MKRSAQVPDLLGLGSESAGRGTMLAADQIFQQALQDVRLGCQDADLDVSLLEPLVLQLKEALKQRPVSVWDADIKQWVRLACDAAIAESENSFIQSFFNHVQSDHVLSHFMRAFGAAVRGVSLSEQDPALQESFLDVLSAYREVGAAHLLGEIIPRLANQLVSLNRGRFSRHKILTQCQLALSDHDKGVESLAWAMGSQVFSRWLSGWQAEGEDLEQLTPFLEIDDRMRLLLGIRRGGDSQQLSSLYTVFICTLERVLSEGVDTVPAHSVPSLPYRVMRQNLLLLLFQSVYPGDPIQQSKGQTLQQTLDLYTESFLDHCRCYEQNAAFESVLSDFAGLEKSSDVAAVQETQTVIAQVVRRMRNRPFAVKHFQAVDRLVQASDELLQRDSERVWGQYSRAYDALVNVLNQSQEEKQRCGGRLQQFSDALCRVHCEHSSHLWVFLLQLFDALVQRVWQGVSLNFEDRPLAYVHKRVKDHLWKQWSMDDWSVLNDLVTIHQILLQEPDRDLCYRPVLDDLVSAIADCIPSWDALDGVQEQLSVQIQGLSDAGWPMAMIETYLVQRLSLYGGSLSEDSGALNQDDAFLFDEDLEKSQERADQMRAALTPTPPLSAVSSGRVSSDTPTPPLSADSSGRVSSDEGVECSGGDEQQELLCSFSSAVVEPKEEKGGRLIPKPDLFCSSTTCVQRPAVKQATPERPIEMLSATFDDRDRGCGAVGFKAFHDASRRRLRGAGGLFERAVSSSSEGAPSVLTQQDSRLNAAVDDETADDACSSLGGSSVGSEVFGLSL